MEDYIFNIKSEADFEEKCLLVFRKQAEENPVYKEWISLLGVKPEKITQTDQIPFLPIEFYRSHRVSCFNSDEDIVFTSSGTSNEKTSRHYVHDLSLYEASFLNGFKHFYGSPENYCFLALLPNYLERSGSSLIYMADKLISLSANSSSGFYLYNHDALKEMLLKLEAKGTKTILLGVSFALLDFFRNNKITLKNTIIIETGGMKGRGKELPREELHTILKEATGLSDIHSEYGMTELLSQAYSKGNSQFQTPPWMKVVIRDTHNPFSICTPGKTGGINVLDLANYHGCSFIETQDMGKSLHDGSFEVLGRFDYSIVRGCNLLV